MISRVADDCFWLGRYLERIESTVRLLGVTRELVFDAELSHEQCWKPVVIVSGEYPSFVEKLGAVSAGNGEIVQHHMIWTPENPVSLRTSVRSARELARTAREVLSLEVWEEINQMYLWLGTDEATRMYAERREQFYLGVRRRTQLCLGLVRSTMLHDDPMRFLWLGVMLERVGQIARILDMHHHTLSSESPHEEIELSLWLALLRACSGFEGFMKRNQGRVSRSAVVSFLVFEQQFPRSLRYCLRSALGVTRQIWPEAQASAVASRAIGALSSLCTWLDAQEKATKLPALPSIHDLLTKIVDQTSEVCAFLQKDMLGPHPATADTHAQ